MISRARRDYFWLPKLGWSAFRKQDKRRGRSVAMTWDHLEARVVLSPYTGMTGVTDDGLTWVAEPIVAGAGFSGGTGTGTNQDPLAVPPYPLTDTFNLSSRPNSNFTIYLDFNGHTTTGTPWNNAQNPTYITPSYSIDADTSTYTNTELENIQRIWQIVAEDFAPFDVNVTTADPGIERLRNTGGGDTQWGTRAIIGNGGPAFNAAGGIAFLNSFNSSIDVGNFTYPGNRGNTNLSVANTISHEVGHTLGLLHDGRTTPQEAYFEGHGTGPLSWGPIMGSGFGTPISSINVFQFSRGEYANANNTEDDLTIVTTRNGFTYRPDDYGDTTATANLLSAAVPPVAVGTGVEMIRTGIIERTTDVDVFRLNTSGGAVTIDLTNFSDSPNLDAEIQILDSTGAVLQTINPAAAMNATYSSTLASGTYYIRVDGVGAANVSTTGYSDYGSLGMYSLRVVAPLNNPPTITGGPFAINENSANGTVVGTIAVTDQDNDTISNLRIVSGNTGNAFSIDPVTREIRVANSTALDFETRPVFTLIIAADDNGFPPATGTGTITINLNNLNEAPTGVAVTPSTINEGLPPGGVVGLLSATDPETTDTHTFQLVPGLNDRDNFRFEIVGNELRALQTLNYEVTPTAFLQVRVTDSANNTFDATLQLVINDINEQPTDIGLTPASISENAGANAVVGTLSAVDEDRSETFVFAFATGAGDTNNSQFTIAGSTLRAVGSFDFETQPTRSIRVRVTDRNGSGLTFEKQFTINVTNLNEAPTDIFLDNASVAEDVPGIEVGLLTATDPDVPSSFTFTLVAGTGSTDNAQFTIVGNSLRAVATGIDFEAGATRNVRIRVSDGLNSYEEPFVITVLNTSEELTISSVSVAENQPVSTVVGTFSTVGGVSPYTYSLVSGAGDDDNASFTVSGNQLVTGEIFNFEVKREYFVRVRSTSTGGAPTFDRAFRVLVTDANDTPSNITLSNNSIPENAPIPTTVGNLAAIDEDTAQTHTFTLPAGIDNNSEFTILGNVLRASSAYNFEAVTSRTVTVRATDNGAPNRFVDRQFTINITNVNEPPTTITFASGGTVLENQPGALVGRISTDDPDAGETFTYRLFPRDQSGPNPPQDDSYLFVVQGDQVFVGPTRLDFETKRNLVIWIRGTDSGNNFIEAAVPITVLNVNDTPEAIGLTGDTVVENEAGARLVGTFASIDADAIGSYSYSLVAGLGATDNSLFQIVGNQLRTSTVFDFEARSLYSIRVRTTDTGGLSAERVFSIRVVDTNEQPFGLAFAPVIVPENAAAGTNAGTLSARDPENGPLTFTLVAGTGDTGNANFRIDGNTLRTTRPLDYETARQHTVRIAVTDNANQTQVGVFVVNVLDRTDPTRFYRAYNRRAEYHFYTTSQSEFEAVLRGPGFRDETTNQSGFNVLGDPTPGAFPIHRVFNFQTQRHYYTTNTLERDALLNLVTPSNPLYGQVGWRYEKDEGFIFANPTPGTVPVYRLYNNQTGVHLYTEATTVRDAVLRQFRGIWEDHGILGYAYPVVVVAPTSASATSSSSTAAPESSAALADAGVTLTPANSVAATSVTAGSVAEQRLETLVQTQAAPIAAAATAGTEEPAEQSSSLPAIGDSSATVTLDELFSSPVGLAGFAELL